MIPPERLWDKTRMDTDRTDKSGLKIYNLLSVKIRFICVNLRSILFENCQNVRLGHDEIFLSIILELGTAILGVENFVADFHIHLDRLAVIIDPSWTYGNNFTFLWFFLCRVGDNDSAGAFRFSSIGRLYENPVC